MRRTLLADRIATGVLWAIGAFVVLVLGAIILHFVLSSIGTISLSFLFSPPSDTSLGGIGPILWNSLYMLVLTMLLHRAPRHPGRHLHGRVRRNRAPART